MCDSKSTLPEPSDVVFSPEDLAQMRGRMRQAYLAAQLSQYLGYPISQTEISQMESGKGFHWGLQRAASRYFRELGWDADGRGNLILVRRDAA